MHKRFLFKAFRKKNSQYSIAMYCIETSVKTTFTMTQLCTITMYGGIDVKYLQWPRMRQTPQSLCTCRHLVVKANNVNTPLENVIATEMLNISCGFILFYLHYKANHFLFLHSIIMPHPTRVKSAPWLHV